MKIRPIVLFLIVGLSVATTGLAQGVGKDDKFGTFSKLKNGAFVYFSTHRSGGSGPVFESIDSEGNANVVHRMLFDRDASGVHFGYDLWVEPIEGSNKFRVTIKPLSQEYKQRLRERNSAGGLRQPDHIASPDPHFPDPLTVDDGDTLTVDVLVNQATGEKIGDIIKISSKPLNARPRVKTTGPPRDLTIADIELKVLGSKIIVNGELEGGFAGGGGGCAGSIIWFYLPNRGRFIISLAPHAGYDFQKVGTIEENKILFSIGGERYEWVSQMAIVGNGGNWNLWVLHDPDYQPGEMFGRTEENPTPEKRAELKAQYELKTDEEVDRFLKRSRCVIGAADAVNTF